MSTVYTKVGWSDYPSKTTKVNATNLNHMDDRIKDHDERVVKIESMATDRESISIAVADWTTSTTYSGYFECVKSLSKTHSINVELRIKPASTIPTSTEKTDFAKIQEMLINEELDEVTLLCTTKPSNAVETYVVG